MRKGEDRGGAGRIGSGGVRGESLLPVIHLLSPSITPLIRSITCVAPPASPSLTCSPIVVFSLNFFLSIFTESSYLVLLCFLVLVSLCFAVHILSLFLFSSLLIVVCSYFGLLISH